MKHLAIAIALTLCQTAAAVDWPADAGPCPKCACEGSGPCRCWCPNDYHRKPITPWAAQLCQFSPNDYARPLPQLRPLSCPIGPNDYDRKPLVKLRSNCLPWYQCVPEAADKLPLR